MDLGDASLKLNTEIEVAGAYRKEKDFIWLFKTWACIT